MLKLVIERTVFLRNMQIVEKAISDNKIRPVLSGLYLEASSGGILMKGTDLDLTITTVMAGDVIEEGKVVFDYKIVEEYVKQISSKTIILSEEEGKLKVDNAEESGKESFSEFSLYDASEFPVLKEFGEGVTFEVNKEMFLNSMEKTIIGADSSTDNIAINCIRVEVEEKKLKLVSSDSFRMVYSEEKLENLNTDNEIIKSSIPLKTIDSLIKIFKTIDEEKIDFSYEGNRISIKAGNITVISRIIELAFPNYKGILGSYNFDKRVILRTKDFESVLKRVLIFARNNINSRNGAVFEFIGNRLIIRAISESAKVKEQIDTLKEGNDIKISLNVKFLLDFLSQYKGDTIELRMLSASNAVLLRAENDESFIYLTMPLALSE